LIWRVYIRREREGRFGPFCKNIWYSSTAQHSTARGRRPAFCVGGRRLVVVVVVLVVGGKRWTLERPYQSATRPGGSITTVQCIHLLALPRLPLAAFRCPAPTVNPSTHHRLPRGQSHGAKNAPPFQRASERKEKNKKKSQPGTRGRSPSAQPISIPSRPDRSPCSGTRWMISA
jgi:hypothetical protein